MKSQTIGIVGPEGPLTKLPHTFPNKIDESLFCGLDLGIGSCGQALLSTAPQKRTIRGFENLPGNISFIGIRAFDVPEVKDESGRVKLKNPERREKRLLRHTIARRAERMKQVRRFLIASDILPSDYHCMNDEWRHRHEQSTPWQWRLDALSRCLTNWEWAVILMHYAKRRGFKSARKGDIAAKGSKGGTLDSTRANHDALIAYQTVARMFDNDSRFIEKVKGHDGSEREVKFKRNKDGNYKSMVLRADLMDEVRAVFAAQREFGSLHASAAIESEYLSILNKQKSLQNPIDLLGDCPFMPGEKRTTSFAPSFELSRALQRLNTITLIRADGSKQLLSAHILSAGGYGSFVADFGSHPKISWADLRKRWNIPESTQFKDVKEGGRRTTKGGGGMSEKEDFCNRSTKRGCANGSYLIRNVIGSDTWSGILSKDLAPLDEIAFSLAFYEVVEDADSDFTILGSLAAKDLASELLAAVQKDLTGERPTLHEFKGTCGISSNVCRRLIPHLMSGMTYDKAMKEAGFCHTDTLAAFKEISNPVVKSVLREVMKQVVNLFDEAGALPARIHIELGRDLGKSIMERNEMDRGIRDRTKAKDSHRDEVAGFKKCPPGSVSNEDLLRYELYLEQGGYCPYSGELLPNPERLYGADLQIDHILPRSRSQDNGYDNKVLVFVKVNQDKKNRTPYEWLSDSPTAWKGFQTRILSMHGIRRRKLRNLLNETFAAEEQTFSERNLNDTRYISRVIMSYLEALYEEAGHTPVREGGKRHVFTRPGAMTSLVRRAWGLENLKKDLDGKRIGDKHHAVDALVCACLAEGDAQWISRLSKCYGSMELKNNPRLVPLGLETPWSGFRADVVEALRQITVSRRERCGAGGPLHLETIYRARRDESGKTITYKRDSVIGSDQKGKPVARYTKPEDIEKIAGIHNERSRWLKDSMLAWIERGSPVDPGKPDLLPRDPQGCLIRKVFVQQKAKQLRPQPQGCVTSGTLVRCDVFSKKGQYHLVPIYTYQLIERTPPMRAITKKKPEHLWTVIDSSFSFEFSLWKNSRFEITYKSGKAIDGCYASVDRDDPRITYSRPDNSGAEKDENGKDISLRCSTKKDVTSFRKVSVDRLGRKFFVKGEKRTWRGAVCI